MSMGMGSAINIGAIQANLDVKSGNLERGLAQARDAVAQMRREMAQLKAESRAGAIQTSEFYARVGQLSQGINDLTGRMSAAYAALGKTSNALGVLNASARQSITSWRRAAMGLMQFSYLVDDLQYGIGAAVNNIGPLILSLTGRVGIAGAAQIAAVGIKLLIDHWSDLMNAIGSGSLRTEADYMRELAAETEGAADAQKKLNQAKKDFKQLTELIESKPAREEERAKEVEKALKDAPFDKLRETYTSSVYQQNPEQPSEEEIKRARGQIAAQMAPVMPMGGGTMPEPSQDQIDTQIKRNQIEAAKTKADATLVEATKPGGGEYLRSLINTMKSRPEKFQAFDIKRLEDLLPENFMTKEEKREQEQEGDAISKGMTKEERDAARKANRDFTHALSRLAAQYNRELQDPDSLKDVEGRFKEALDDLTSKYKLSADQQARVQEVQDDFASRLEDANENKGEKDFNHALSRLAQKYNQELRDSEDLGETELEFLRSLDKLTSEHKLSADQQRRIREAVADFDARLEGAKETKAERDQRELDQKTNKLIHDHPEADEQARSDLYLRMARGEANPVDKLAKQLKEQLMAGGEADEATATAAARKIAERADEKNREEITRRALGYGHHQNETRHSEVITGTAIGARVQSAVSNANRVPNLLEGIKEILAQQLRFQQAQQKNVVNVQVKR